MLCGRPHWGARVYEMKANYKNSAVIPDTSALMKNCNVLNFLLEDFKTVIISQTTLDELNFQKDKKKNNQAWLAMQKIEQVKKKLQIHNDRNLNGINNDERIRALAAKIHENNKTEVFIIHDDIGFSLNYKNALLLREYIGSRKNNGENSSALQILDKLFMENWSEYRISESVDYDSYLENGNTLLINCIRSKNSNKMKKLEFLVNQCRVNMDKTDSSKYFLTPLSHCIQVNDFEAFCFLLENGADYNKGSINETHIEYIRCRNEGNTPLMIACWHGRRKFVEKLCSYSDIGLNQQDSNGFTPLIKCAWKKNKELYEYLLTFPRTDIYIRDRNNHTAEWWMTHSNKESNGR
jgi:ankyrin repeat protein